jgi:hypothetical protein
MVGGYAMPCGIREKFLAGCKAEELVIHPQFAMY